jgi:uncharacterized protein (DUF2236 family)
MVSYRAADKDLLLWVHIAFMESFLVCHQMFAKREIPKGDSLSGADNYVSQWSVSVTPLGLTACPMTELELEDQITSIHAQGLLAATDDTRRVVDFIQHPPLPLLARPIYRLLFDAAVVSLRPEFRTMLGLKAKPRFLIQPITRGVLRFMRLAIGPESPIEDGAILRLQRIGAWPV